MCGPAPRAKRQKVKVSTQELDARINPIPEPTLTRITGPSGQKLSQLKGRRAGITQLGSFRS